MALDALLDAIAEQGWFIWDDFLTAEQVQSLRDCAPENWKRARIGRNDDLQRETTIRSDKIQWLSQNMAQPVQDYLERMEQIRQAVNRDFFLGLFEYEAHFAKYEQGDFYKKHLDAFRGQENRKLTTVFYMNEAWQPDDGGELKIYDLDDQLIDTVAPVAGRLVVFLSEKFPHEVLPTHADRVSIAGWFRTNGVTANKLDIAN
ncbi:2OG-Fe(II) oxygenase [Vibrio fluvialis]|uniref:2OG-Fe(II) oxygenase n=1 Tax=Vibrio fluvialis TaxID=676 RepID=UPI00192C16FB|nr:2OG-Fe(II) oxygenase [Vibrio fluvialis]EKO3424899.1 2OG-Fe(II) oxygenase [Vibrio fluvialis]EKO3953260.1 2OG-Fe(II) oxygenase [Vibrio fluvialis]ELH4233994.1 2OG-Fe(II) oxygenase [Vibrio fluvialis]ELO1780199.1 2OG-Fe(II) oxygenase [Vibrio fluvialis]ELX7501494.1 2OG-Fe(II) oxygenase [Vibrio fluvialis]